MYRVIIADDEPKVSLLIQNLIQWEALGLTLVGTASDGISALGLIEELRPDIVITDIRMPGYDGIQLISRAKALNPAMDFVIISGYRHFDYAQQAIRFGVEDYLLKPLKAVEINGTLGKMTAKYRERDQADRQRADSAARLAQDAQKREEQFLGALLTPEEPPLETLEQINHTWGLALQGGLYQGFLVKPDLHYDSLNAHVRRLLMEKTAVLVREALGPRCHCCLVYPTEQGIYGVANIQEEALGPLRKSLMGVIDSLQAQGELFDRIKVTVGLGGCTPLLGEIGASLREAEAAAADRLITGAGRIIDFSKAEDHPEGASPVITPECRKGLLQGIEILDAEKIRGACNEIFLRVQSEPGLRGKAILQVWEDLVQILHFGLKSQNALDEVLVQGQRVLLEKLDMCNRQRDGFALLIAYGTEAVDHVASLRKSENSRPVRESQKYIHAHFGSPISLESLSQRAGFNAAYFSQLFKKETGMNFLEYLTDVRIREAKRLLGNPGKTIAEVAEEVGYSDVKHFSKLFTRLTGIHPSKYRKLYY